LIQNTDIELKKICAFLDINSDLHLLAEAVHPELYRNKA
jgi:hypothetical protein